MSLNADVRAHADTVNRIHGVSYDRIAKQDKHLCVRDARRHFWFLLCIESRWSLPRTGKATGHHHTSVLHGIRALSAQFYDTSLTATLDEIRETYFAAIKLEEAA